MNLTYEDFGLDWSRYEHKWFSTRLAWTAQSSSCRPANANQIKKPDVQKESHTIRISARLTEKNCDQIVDSVNYVMGALKAMAHTDRLTALLLIAAKPRKVSELTEILGSRQPAVSQLLARLRDGNLVAATKIGKQVEYSIIDDKTKFFIEHFSEILSTFPASGRQKDVERKELRI